MALPHEAGTVEIGCNLQASSIRDSPSLTTVLEVVIANLPDKARVTKSYVVGLTAADALGSALAQLSIPNKREQV